MLHAFQMLTLEYCVSDHFQDRAPLRVWTPGTYWKGGRQSLRVILDVVAKRGILTSIGNRSPILQARHFIYLSLLMLFIDRAAVNIQRYQKLTESTWQLRTESESNCIQNYVTRKGNLYIWNWMDGILRTIENNSVLPFAADGINMSYQIFINT
jgi:hypothetical protein